jgi:hypothetical protein
MSSIVQKFWDWYERHYSLVLKITTVLFLWQIIHLIWLAIVVVFPRLFSYPSPDLPSWFNLLLALVDYTEIPALISTSLLYINELRKQFSWKSVWLLLFLNTQWLHLFWITDEFVLNAFAPEAAVVIPVWLAWVAIMIDYLEVPVMYDTIKKWLNLKKSDSK